MHKQIKLMSIEFRLIMDPCADTKFGSNIFVHQKKSGVCFLEWLWLVLTFFIMAGDNGYIQFLPVYYTPQWDSKDTICLGNITESYTKFIVQVLYTCEIGLTSGFCIRWTISVSMDLSQSGRIPWISNPTSISDFKSETAIYCFLRMLISFSRQQK